MYIEKLILPIICQENLKITLRKEPGVEKKIVVKGTKSQILGVFYRTLASMSSNPSDRKFLNKEGKIIERTRQEGKVYVGTITCI